jgi:hypothetical protein
LKGRSPFKNYLEGEGDKKKSQREAKPLLYNHSPFPLTRGRGIKGDGVDRKCRRNL